MRFRAGIVAAAVWTALALATTATAGPNYFARAGTSSNTFSAGDQKESSEGVTVDIVSPVIQDHFILFHSGEGHAAAGPFGLRAGGRGTMDLATTTEHGFIPASFGHGGGGFATMTLNDIVVSGPPGADSVPGSLNLSANGAWETTALVSGPFIGAASAGVRVKLEVQICTPVACPGFQGELKAGQSMSADGHIDQSLERTGLFDGFLGGGLISTGLVDLPLDTPVFLQIKLDVNGGSDFQVGGTGCCDPIRIDTNGIADFTHTVTFPTAGPVFNLPPGFTVNAPSIGIVNNHWTLGDPAPDSTPPAIVCDAPDGVWHASDVSLQCTASDSDSGLADAGDSSFSLATSVPDGTETPDAQTGSRQVCDAAGNCAVAGPIGGNKVDRRAPSISLDVPASQRYLLNAAVAASYDCADGGSGLASCAGPVPSSANIDTGSVGVKPFAVAATDSVGNQTSKSADYTVGYAVKLLYDPARPTRTLKLQLHDANGTNVSAAAIVLQAQSIDGSIPLSRMFTYVSWCAQYRFALPRGLSPGPHTLYFTAAGDPTVHAAVFRTR